MSRNVIFGLPSGVQCVRVEVLGVRRYILPQPKPALTVQDVEALYADSIAADGGAPGILSRASAGCGCNPVSCCRSCECGESHP